MKVGLIQLTTGRDIDLAVEDVCARISEAADIGSEFISTPETTHLMEMRKPDVFDKAYSEVADPGLKRFQALAKEKAVWLHIGSLIIKLSDEKLANRSFLIDPSGKIVARYDKIHLFDVTLGGGESYRESATYQAGKTAVVYEAPKAIFGLSVCYDVRFPGLYRTLAQAGANILLVPAAFTQPTGEAHWHTLLRARAIENGCFVLAAAQTGMHETGRKTYGHSLIIDPWGNVLSDGGTENGIIIHDLNMSLVDKARARVPSLEHDKEYDLKAGSCVS